MLVFGAASHPWEMLSSLQPANAGAAVGGIGVGQFDTDITSPVPPATGSAQFAPPPTGTTGQAALSPDVLGFLIWNQSQQPGAASWATGGSNPGGANGASNVPAAGTDGGADTAGITGWPSFPSWFSPVTADGTGTASSTPDAFSGNGGTPAAANSPTQLSADPALTTGGPGAPESSGAHARHYHLGGFAIQSQSDPSDPLATLLGTSAQGASSTTAANADGSTTTTITYADGSEVTLTTAPQASAANPGPAAATAQLPFNPNNFLETLIQLQARLLAPIDAA